MNAMVLLRQAWARLVSFCRKRERDEDLDQELASHIELAAEDLVRRGVAPVEALRMARVKFGSMEASKEEHRDARGLPWLEMLLYDLKFAIRGLRRDRAFAITAVAMLALAIGLNVTVFAVMNTMLFRGFPLVKRNDRLLYMQERNPVQGCCLSYPDFENWRTEAKSFEGMAFVAGKQIALDDGSGGRALRTFAATVSSNAFGLLGVAPMLGRDFVPADEEPGAPPVAILSYRFWESRMGKRADIVGRAVRINNAPATILGVMPKGFDFPQQQNLWMALEHTAEMQQRAPGGYMAFGCLREGATAAGARAELETINRRLAKEYPTTNRDVVPRVDTHSQFFIGPDAPVIYGSLWAAGWFVLLIACGNLANLTLARTLGRSREFSTRLALGAGHWRMVRQILAESLLLAGVGGLLGWWIAKWSVHTWAVATESEYQILDYTMSGGVLAYLAVISMGAALMFGLAPIGRVLHLDVTGTLKSDSRGATQGLRAKYLSAALVAGQMALAILLLSGAGVLVRSLMKVVRADTGVSSPEKVLIGRVDVPEEKYARAESRINFFDLLKARLMAIPGVESESIASTIPAANPGSTAFEQDPSVAGMEGRQSASTIASGTDYFRTVGALTIAGREFNDADRPGTLPVAMVNQSFVAKYWPGQNPIGKRLRLLRRNKPGEWRVVVGVASNIMQDDPTRQKFLPVIYVPSRQEPRANAALFVRMRTPSSKVMDAVAAEVRKLDPDLIFEDYSTLEASFAFDRDRMDVQHMEMGKYAAVAPIFAVLALFLAAVGLYAVIAHSVSQRTKEIGVRMALGAAAGSIRRMVFREGMVPVVIGLIAGLAASLGVNRVLQSQLVGVSPYDPATFTAAPIVLVLVALLGCQIPALRAMRVDPVVALRHD